MCRLPTPSTKEREKSLFDLTTKLGHRKCQRALLESSMEIDLLSSLRPKVGKVFTEPELEREKVQLLEKCRQQLITLAIKDADRDIVKLVDDRSSMLKSFQGDMSKSRYSKLCNTLKMNERNVITTIDKKHQNRLHTARKRNSSFVHTQIGPPPPPPPPSISRPDKHPETIRSKRIDFIRKQRKKVKEMRY